MSEGFVREGFVRWSNDNSHGLSSHLRNPRKTPFKGESETVLCENCGAEIQDSIIWHNEFGEPVCPECRVEIYGEGFEEEEIQLLDADFEEAQDVYEKFHGRSSEKLDKLKIPRPQVLAYMGQPSACGYSSDKFSPGEMKDYIHQWDSKKSREGGIVAYDPESRCLFSIVPCTITSRGIEDALDEKEEENPVPPGAGMVALTVAPAVIEGVGAAVPVLYREWRKRKRKR